MKVTINGTEREITGIGTVKELLDHLGLDCSRVAVEINQHVVKKEDYDKRALSSGDVVEIVRFVGGG